MSSEQVQFWLFDLGARVLGWLPLRWLHAAAVPIAQVLAILPWNKHAVVQKNLSVCFPDLSRQAREELARTHRVELLRLISEIGAVAHWSGKRLSAHLQADSAWESVQSALARGRGVLIVTGHLGNWEILNLELSRRMSMVTLYRSPDNPAVERFISTARSRFGGRVVASGSAAMRHLLRQLRNGGAVGIAADIQPKQGDGIFVPFCGVPALTMTLVHRLAQKTGCMVVFGHAIRLDAGQGWRLDFKPAPPAFMDSDPTQALLCFNAWLTEGVRAHPGQYLWIYKRFSKRPESGPRFYPRP